MGQARQPAAQPPQAPAQVVAEQLAGGRDRRRGPRRRDRAWARRHPGPAAPPGPPSRRRRPPWCDGHGGTGPPAAPAGRAGARPPQRPGRGPAAAGTAGRTPPAAGPRRRVPAPGGPDVVGEVEGGGVDPQRPAQAPSGPVQQLPEARDQVEPRLQPPADLVDPDAAVGVQQAGAVQDGEHADVLRPAEVVRQQHQEVLGGQPLHAAWLGHGVLPPRRCSSPDSSCLATGAWPRDAAGSRIFSRGTPRP